MSKNQNNRLRPVQLQADQDALIALRSIEGYAPANPAYALQAVQDKLSNMTGIQEDEVNAQNALASARDLAAAAEWDFHNSMLGVKDQVIAQYGKDSDEMQAMGLKKKSEHKAPRSKKKAGE